MIILRKFNSGLKSKVLVYLYKVSDGKAVTDSQGDIRRISLAK